MKRLVTVLGMLLALVLATTAAAQRGERGRMGEMLAQHLTECEVCAKKAADMEPLESELRDLEAERQKIMDKRVVDQLTALIEAHPDQGETIEKLRTTYQKVAEMRDQLRSLQSQARELMQGLDLTREERRALQGAAGASMPLGGLDRPWAGGMRGAGGPGGVGPAGGAPDNPQAAERARRWEEQNQRRLEQLKTEDPDLYKIAVKENEVQQKLATARRDLFETARQHMSATQPPSGN